MNNNIVTQEQIDDALARHRAHLQKLEDERRKRLPPAPGPPIALPCYHQGIQMPAPRGKPIFGRDYILCDAGKGVVCKCHCNRDCDRYQPEDWDQPTPFLTHRMKGLVPPGKQWGFNAGLLRYQDKLLMPFRDGWAGSRIHIAELNEDYSVAKMTLVPLSHPRAHYGCEDPQLSIHRGKLLLGFVGVQGRGNRGLHTDMLFAGLSDDYRVEWIKAPRYTKAPENKWEKNWSHLPLTGGGREEELFMVYSIKPLIVVRIEGDQAIPYIEHHNPFPWSGGYLHGGTPYYRRDEEFFSFFHGAWNLENGGHYPQKGYTVGAVSLNVNSLAVERMTPHPILVADEKDRPQDQYCQCVFPRGAVWDGDRIKIAMGLHDRFSQVVEFRARDIDRAMWPRKNRDKCLTISAAFFEGRDLFNSGRKVTGRDQPAGELSGAERMEYLRPFYVSSQTTENNSLILTTALDYPDRVFRPVKGDGPFSNAENRFYAVRDAVSSLPDDWFAWVSDVNDVILLENLYGWSQEYHKTGHLFVGEEFNTYNYDWFDRVLEFLPGKYRECIKGRNGARCVLTCGVWGGMKVDVLWLLNEMIRLFEELRQEWSARQFIPDVGIDMHVFALALMDGEYNDRVIPFKTDGKTTRDGVRSPVIHDRKLAMEYLEQQ